MSYQEPPTAGAIPKQRLSWSSDIDYDQYPSAAHIAFRAESTSDAWIHAFLALTRAASWEQSVMEEAMLSYLGERGLL